MQTKGSERAHILLDKANNITVEKVNKKSKK